MKKVLLLLVISFLNADVKWVSSYEEATKANKPIFIYIAREGCPACAYMNKTLKDKKIYGYLNEHFVAFKKYVGDPKTKLPYPLRSSRTPTLHFVNSEGKKLIESYNGGKNVEGFYELLREVKGE